MISGVISEIFDARQTVFILEATWSHLLVAIFDPLSMNWHPFCDIIRSFSSKKPSSPSQALILYKNYFNIALILKNIAFEPEVSYSRHTLSDTFLTYPE